MNDAISTHVATAADEPTLWLMLTFAASISAPTDVALATARPDPYLRGYVENWTTADGDVRIVARNSRGENVGAAWIRLGLGDGAVRSSDRLTPELAIGTLPGYRGRGIGSTMLRALIASARMRFDRIAFFVRESNPATEDAGP